MTIGERAVLVVEDDSDIRALLTETLKEDGYRVVAVDDGGAAIQMLLQAGVSGTHFCMLLLDLMLPRVSGLQVLAYLREHDMPIPVVAMSASPQHLNNAKRAGASFAIEKPFDLHEIVTLLDCQCLHD